MFGPWINSFVSNRKMVFTGCAAVCWTLWKTRNDICFNKTPWTGMQVLWRRLVSTLAQWVILLSEGAREQLNTVLFQLEKIARSHPLLTWRDPG